MIKCNYCGFENKGGNRFCVACGHDLETNTYNCIFCGYDNPTFSHFCGNCGKNLNLNNDNIRNDNEMPGFNIGDSGNGYSQNSNLDNAFQEPIQDKFETNAKSNIKFGKSSIVVTSTTIAGIAFWIIFNQMMIGSYYIGNNVVLFSILRLFSYIFVGIVIGFLYNALYGGSKTKIQDMLLASIFVNILISFYSEIVWFSITYSTSLIVFSLVIFASTYLGKFLQNKYNIKL